MLDSLSTPLLTDKQDFIVNISANIYLDKDGYDELEDACYTELGIGFPYKRTTKMDTKYERVLAK
jgi:hypothetical protein